MKPGISDRAGIPAGRSSPHGRGRGPALRFLLAGAGAAAAVTSVTLASPAGADPDTTASVVVDSSIALTNLPASFQLTGVSGAPGATNGATVNYTVTTNDPAGYVVSVLSQDDVLLPTDPVANTDTIPIATLQVESTTGFVAVSDSVRRTVVSSEDPTDADGDNLSNDFRMVIPHVNPDTYSVTLDYLAAVPTG